MWRIFFSFFFFFFFFFFFLLSFMKRAPQNPQKYPP